MNYIKDIIILCTIAFLIALGAGFFIARTYYAPPKITAQTFLTAIQQEGFFVTESLMLEETVTIDNRSGNALKDFFVSENIQAEALIKVAMGIDTTRIDGSDIRIEGNTVQLTLPTPTVFSTEIIGDIDIDAERGIITRITSKEEDYNGLVALLKEQSRASVTDPDIAGAVQLGTIASLTRFFSLIAPQYTPVISFE